MSPELLDASSANSKVSITPSRLDGRTGATYDVTLHNSSRNEVEYVLGAFATDRFLAFDHAKRIKVRPNGSEQIHLTIKCRATFFGIPKVVKFSVQGSTTAGEMGLVASAEFVRKPYINVLVALAILGFLAVAVLELSSQRRPLVATSPTPVITSEHNSPRVPPSIEKFPYKAVSLHARHIGKKTYTAYLVSDLGVPILTITYPDATMSPAERAGYIADRLNDIQINDLSPSYSLNARIALGLTSSQVNDLLKHPRKISQLRDADDEDLDPIVFFGYSHKDERIVGDLIVTIDTGCARECKTTDRMRVACWWRDMLRDWLLIGLGKPPQYTIPYTNVMMEFYQQLHLQPGKFPMSADFRRVAKSMKEQQAGEYNKLVTLYMRIPSNFKKQQSFIHNPDVTAESAAGVHS